MVFVWILATAVAAGLELVTADLTFALIAVGLGAAAGAAYLDWPLWAQFLVAAGVAGFGLVVVRPIALRQIRRPAEGSLTNVDALLGARGRALREVGEGEGLVRIGGEEWSARLAPGARPLPEGSAVVVIAIDGATAVVAPVAREEDP